MALIGAIQNKGRTIVVALVAFTMLMFVGNDLFTSLKGGSPANMPIGVIAGVEVPNESFQQELKSREEAFRNSRGQSPNENEKAQIQEEVWNSYVYDIAFGNEFDELGVIVGEDELYDLVQGNYIHAQLRNQFKGPDGQFNKNQLISYLQFIGQEYDAQQMPVSQEDFFRMKTNFLKFEKELPLTRKVEKFNALMGKSTYVTTLEAKSKYKADNESVSAKILYVPFMSILDSTIEVTDADLKAYINENKKEYQSEQSVRSLEYIVFPVIASADDSAYVRDEIAMIKKDFMESDNDSLFVRAKADNPELPKYSSLGNVPKLIQDEYPNIDSGMVFGPILDAGAYRLFKVSGIKEDTVYSARASHILFKAASKSDEDLAVALADCKKVLREIQNGADFAEMASIHGTDGTKDIGGDLGWFTEGRMVPEFNDAVMDATREGVLPSPVKTDFGYHIIKITGVKTNLNYQISSVDREIIPGEETRELAYQRAANFAGEYTNLESFRSGAEADTLQIQKTENIASKERFLQGAGNARSAVQWAFRKSTEVGEVSDVLDLDAGYLVAALASSTDKGETDIEALRSTVERKVLNKKKADQIIAKLNSTSGSLEDRLNAYGTEATIIDAPSVTLSTGSIPGLGFEPALPGYFLGLNQGESAGPVAGENGVVIIEATAKTEAPEKQDYTAEKSQLLNQVKGKVSGSSFEAVKKAADIEDNRVSFL